MRVSLASLMNSTITLSAPGLAVGHRLDVEGEGEGVFVALVDLDRAFGAAVAAEDQLRARLFAGEPDHAGACGRRGRRPRRPAAGCSPSGRGGPAVEPRSRSRRRAASSACGAAVAGDRSGDRFGRGFGDRRRSGPPVAPARAGAVIPTGRARSRSRRLVRRYRGSTGLLARTATPIGAGTACATATGAPVPTGTESATPTPRSGSDGQVGDQAVVFPGPQRSAARRPRGQQAAQAAKRLRVPENLP